MNLHGCSVYMFEHVCVFEITFVFHAVACVCAVLLIVLLEIPTTLFLFSFSSFMCAMNYVYNTTEGKHY